VVWSAGLALFVMLGVAVLGLGVSVTLAPIYSERNLLVTAPMFWLLCAALFEAARPNLARAGGKALAALIILALAGSQAVYVRGRFLPRVEEWRGAAQFVDLQTACSGQVIPVLALQTFGPHTPYFLQLEERRFYGHYAKAPQRLRVFMPSDFGGRDRDSRSYAPETGPPARPTAAELARARPDLTALMRARLAGGSSTCPVLALANHVLVLSDAENLRQAIAATAGVPEGRVILAPFRHYRLGYDGWLGVAEDFVVMARRS